MKERKKASFEGRRVERKKVLLKENDDRISEPLVQWRCCCSNLNVATGVKANLFLCLIN
jgi:hypothetical protein